MSQKLLAPAWRRSRQLTLSKFVCAKIISQFYFYRLLKFTFAALEGTLIGKLVTGITISKSEVRSVNVVFLRNSLLFKTTRFLLNILRGNCPLLIPKLLNSLSGRPTEKVYEKICH